MITNIAKNVAKGQQGIWNAAPKGQQAIAAIGCSICVYSWRILVTIVIKLVVIIIFSTLSSNK